MQGVQGQPGVHREALSQKENNNIKNGKKLSSQACGTQDKRQQGRFVGCWGVAQRGQALSTIVKGKTSWTKFSRKQGFLCSVGMLTKLLLGASMEPLCSCVHEGYRLMAYVANMLAWSNKSLQVRFPKGTNTGVICRRYSRAQFRSRYNLDDAVCEVCSKSKLTRFFMSWLCYQAILHWQQLCHHVILYYDPNRDICSKQWACLQASWTWQTPSWYFLFPALQNISVFAFLPPKLGT